MVAISVADSGAGIAPEIAAQLFQPFVTSKAQGMGVGLSISRTIIEAHGGTIAAEPEQRRRNGVFVHVARRGQARRSAMPSEKLVVHVIDDDEASRAVAGIPAAGRRA